MLDDETQQQEAQAEPASETGGRSGRRQRGGGAAVADAENAGPPFPRLKLKFREEIIPQMMREFSYANPMEVPRLQKIVLNIGLGEALTNGRAMEAATTDLTTISGQKPIITRARKSIAGFKIRQGNSIGAAVTLRGDRMYHFLDRLVNTALPRIRDFRGMARRGMDGPGQLFPGHQGTDHLSRNRLQFHRPDPWTPGNHYDHGAKRRRGHAAAGTLRLSIHPRSVTEERRGQVVPDTEVAQEAQIPGSGLQPLRTLRPPPGPTSAMPASAAFASGSWRSMANCPACGRQACNRFKFKQFERARDETEMPVTDPIADMLTRIRNAIQARHDSVMMPHSKMKLSIARVLKDEGFIRDFDTPRGHVHPTLRIHLSYREGRQSAIAGLKRGASPASGCMSERVKSRGCTAAWGWPSFPRPRA